MQQRVFVSGFNKSGTTMLQQALDAHEKIVCPPEHHLTTMVNGFKKTCESYMNVIVSFDKNTGQQGVDLKIDRLYWRTVKAFTAGVFDEGITDKSSVTCIHDNSMTQHHFTFSQLFPGAKWIWIVRDPRAVALSIFKHKTRLESETLPDDFNLSKVCKSMGPNWDNHINTIYRVAAANPAQHHILKYEDLSGENAEQTLANVFDFLGVSPLPSVDIIKTLQMKKSKGKGGYISGNANEAWKDALSEADQEAILVKNESRMKELGYLP